MENNKIDREAVIEKGKRIYDLIQEWQNDDEGWKEIESSTDPEFKIFKYVLTN